jgi:hypothetical protein
MKRILLLAVSAILLLTSCNLFNNYGKKYKVNDKSTVYYKGDGVTEADAKKLGEFLIQQGYFDTTSEKAVQLTKSGDDYALRFVVDKDKLEKNKDAIPTFWRLQNTISEDVFNGKKTKIILADDKLKDIQNVGSITKYNVKGQNDIFYDDDAFKKSEAEALGTLMTDQGYFDGSGEKQIYLSKEDGTNMVRFIVNKDAVQSNLTAYLPIYEYMQFLIKDNVFNGKNTSMVLTSSLFDDFQKIPEITVDQKNQIEQQLKMANQQQAANDPNTQTQYSGQADSTQNENQ